MRLGNRENLAKARCFAFAKQNGGFDAFFVYYFRVAPACAGVN